MATMKASRDLDPLQRQTWIISTLNAEVDMNIMSREAIVKILTFNPFEHRKAGARGDCWIGNDA